MFLVVSLLPFAKWRHLLQICLKNIIKYVTQFSSYVSFFAMIDIGSSNIFFIRLKDNVMVSEQIMLISPIELKLVVLGFSYMKNEMTNDLYICDFVTILCV